MKKVDLLILRAYAGPFILTFFIVVFFFIMQFFFVYIDDFVGKGLEWYFVAELILYLSANTIPIALPLAVLLSAIMTYGNLGERYELSALKSAGIPLTTFMRPVFIVVLFLSIGSLAFSDYVMPRANLKFYTSLLDITQSKPALNIKENVFYTDIKNYVLRIDRKDSDNKRIYGVYIADQSSRMSNDNILIADHGEMFTTDDNRYLVLKLYDGFKYEILPPDRDKNIHVRVRTRFEELEKVMDLSDFEMTRSSEDIYKDHYIMMSIGQLDHYIDSLDKERGRIMTSFYSDIIPYYYFLRDSSEIFLKENKIPVQAGSEFIDLTDQAQMSQTFTRGMAFARNVKERIESPLKVRLDSNHNYINRAKIEYHRKFMLAFSCLVLLMIGAPFGALIRKGGIGFPVLFAVLFYITYYIFHKVGEGFAKEGALSPFIGMWMASFIMLPFGIVFTYKAMHDSPIMIRDTYTKFFKRLSRIGKPKWVKLADEKVD